MEPRENYQTQMEKQLNEWKAQTERFNASADQIAANSKAQYDKQLESLRAAQANAWDNFYKLKGASESTWTEFKADMDKAGGELKAAFESMTTSFKH